MKTKLNPEIEMKIILIDFERNLKSSPSDRVFFVPTTYLYFFAPNSSNQRKKTKKTTKKKQKSKKKKGRTGRRPMLWRPITTRRFWTRRGFTTRPSLVTR